MLGYEAQIGQPWAIVFGVPVYRPGELFAWWYHYDAYAPEVFDKAGALAAASGFLGCASAIAGSLWRARQNRHVTTLSARDLELPAEFGISLSALLGTTGDTPGSIEPAREALVWVETRLGDDHRVTMAALKRLGSVYNDNGLFTLSIYDHLIMGLRENDLIATFNWDPLLLQAFQRAPRWLSKPRLALLWQKFDLTIPMGGFP